jgi:hypothetical protein
MADECKSRNSAPQAAWAGGVCKTCGAYTHSCKCEHPGRDAFAALFAAPQEGAGSSAGPATNGEPAAAAITVPRKPTPEMLKAALGWREQDPHEALTGQLDMFERIWRVMVEAAPIVTQSETQRIYTDPKEYWAAMAEWLKTQPRPGWDVGPHKDDPEPL